MKRHRARYGGHSGGGHSGGGGTPVTITCCAGTVQMHAFNRSFLVTVQFVPAANLVHYVDSNGDGHANAAAVDLNGDGQTNAVGVLVDRTNDGMADSVGLDTTGDGVVDTYISLNLGTGNDTANDFKATVKEMSPGNICVSLPTTAAKMCTIEQIVDAIEEFVTNSEAIRHSQKIINDVMENNNQGPVVMQMARLQAAETNTVPVNANVQQGNLATVSPISVAQHVDTTYFGVLQDIDASVLKCQLGNFVYQKNMETDKMEGKMPDGTPLGTLVSSNCSLAVEVQVTEIYEKPSDCCCIIC